MAASGEHEDRTQTDGHSEPPLNGAHR
jgi:hypothetical protein